LRAILLAILKSGTGQVTALLCAAISVKILAVTIGPAGVGLYSLLRQIQQTLCALASMGGQNAVVQGVASRDDEARAVFVRSVLVTVAVCAGVVCLVTALFADPLADLLMGDDTQGSGVIRWIALPVAAGTLLIFFRGLLNAHMEIGAVAWVNIAAAVGAVLFAYPAARLYAAGNEIGLIAILTGSLGIGLIFALYQAKICGCLAAFASPTRWFDATAVRQFLKVALPSLAALFMGMGGLLAVRAAITRWHGLPAAGQFDAAWSISLTFVIVFLTSLQTYLLPALSAIRSDEQWREVLLRALRLSMMIAVPLLTTLIVLKPIIVRLLYSGEFLVALDLLRWTLIGDYLRVAAWVLATTLVARSDMRAYLGTEILWNLIFVALALWLVPTGIAGAGPAYVTAYGLYLGVLVWRIVRTHGLALRARSIAQWLGGAGIVFVSGALAWSDVALEPLELVLIPVALGFSWLAMTPEERRFTQRIRARMLVHLLPGSKRPS